MATEIKNGIHGCSAAENYIAPQDPKVLEKLETFQDRKLGFMMHWAPVTQWGITESWPQVDTESEWSQKEIDWTDDMESFRKDYRNLYTTFNPVAFQPKKWASLAKNWGFKYLLFTTKHHDGFCMWDTETTDYKITSEACPFHTHPNKDIVKSLYDAFRDEGLGIHTYFSKPDWDSTYYWHKETPWPNGMTDRNPNYVIKEHPERWEAFIDYTHRQIKELMTNYGPIDCLWLDGGWVAPSNLDQDIRLGSVVEHIRETSQPGLICADRTVGGAYENFITPEQSKPSDPILVPWESCITLGKSFSFHFNDQYKSPREIIHLLIDIVAKGGNLALNVTPQPDGHLPHEAMAILDKLGEFLKIYGEGIYGSRVCSPYVSGQYAYTKKQSNTFVYYLYADEEQAKETLDFPYEEPVTSVHHMVSGKPLTFQQKDGFIHVDLGPHEPSSYVEGIRLTSK